MKKYLGISISVGIVAAVWVIIAGQLEVPAWITFVGWSIFFFAGANFEACKKSLPCIILGGVLAYIAIYIQVALGTGAAGSTLVIFFLAFSMTIFQGIPIFSLAPATFLGCANYFATGDLFYTIVLTSMGLVLGIVTMALGDFLDSIFFKKINQDGV